MVTSAEPAEVRALQVPLSEYEGIPGVAKAARVAMYWASVPLAQRISNLRLLAIDRLDFPQVSYYRSDYSALPLGELMNRLGSRSDGILLPSYVATQLQLGVGNKLPIRVVVGKDTSAPIEMTIVGTFDYFPTMYRELASVVVANLDYLQTETGGGLPWDIWLRLKPGADTGQILKDVSRTGVTAYAPRDLGRRIQRDQDRLERVGIFGMLSVCFVASAVLASIGLVVYSLAAMMARGFRFAVWQALGMRRSEVIGVVLLEYSVMLLYALASGMAWGVLAAYLYGPYFRLTESVQVPVPPFVPLVDWQRAIWMALLVGVVLILIQGGVLLRVARARVFEVLRMGTRE
jgi:putative ABC transport system permease protein